MFESSKSDITSTLHSIMSQPLTSISSTLEPITESSTSTSSTLNPEITEFKSFLFNSRLAILKIVREAQDVSIDTKRLKETAEDVFDYITSFINNDSYNEIGNTAYRHAPECFPTRCSIICDWFFVLNALNFSLWSPQGTKQWTVNGQTGYKALCAAIKRASTEGRPIWNPKYYSKLDKNEIKIIFRSDNETTIPLIRERIRVLHEIGRVLLDKYQGTFENCVNACEDDTLKLRHLLFTEFESYRDQVNYNGQDVYIGCKIETLLCDLYFFGKILKCTHWISTMFTDYCSPQALFHLKILRYSDTLKARFAEQNKPLKYESREALEILCCSIIAMRKWSQELTMVCKKKLPVLEDIINFPVILDNFLWAYRHSMEEDGLTDTVPFHNIRSTYF